MSKCTMLKGINITCNYSDDSVDAAIPTEMSLAKLLITLVRLCDSEPEMTSFVLTCAVEHVETSTTV